MKRCLALLLALILITALAGCDRGEAKVTGTGSGGEPSGSVGPATTPVGSGTAPATGPAGPSGATEPAGPTAPPITDPDALRLGLMDDAAALGAAGLYGGTYTLVTRVTDPGGDLASGALDAAVVPVDAAARIYAETDGKVSIAAVTAAGGWGIVERGNAVHNIWDLAAKTVWTDADASVSTQLFTYVAERYDFIVGDTLKLESVPAAKLAEQDLALMPAKLAGVTLVRDPDTHKALDLGEEWTAITGSDFLPAACLVVSADMTDQDLEALKADLKASQEAVSDSLDKAVALGLAANQEEAWASLECLTFTWLEGADTVREALYDYFSVLYRLDPELIGGYIPDDGFYR